MQAVTLTYKGPTNTRVSRILARCEAGTYTHDWDYDLNDHENTIEAARGLFAKLGWNDGRFDSFVLGTLPGGKGDVAIPTWENCPGGYSNTYAF